MSGQMNAIVRRIEKHPLIFDWDRNGLGQAVIKLVAKEIMRAMEQEVSPTGEIWPELSEAYDAWKSRHYPGQPMAVLTGHMKTLEQLIGLYRITAREIGQTYGVDEEARALAEWFQEGKKDNKGDYVQPPRPFYKFGPIVLGIMAQYLEAHFARSI